MADVWVTTEDAQTVWDGGATHWDVTGHTQTTAWDVSAPSASYSEEAAASETYSEETAVTAAWSKEDGL